MENEEEWLTLSQAAALSKTSRANIHQHIERKTFEAKAVRVSTAQTEWRINRRSFQNWLETREQDRRGRKQTEAPGRQRRETAIASPAVAI